MSYWSGPSAEAAQCVGKRGANRIGRCFRVSGARFVTMGESPWNVRGVTISRPLMSASLSSPGLMLACAPTLHFVVRILFVYCRQTRVLFGERFLRTTK